jgi:hypothetical protein
MEINGAPPADFTPGRMLNGVPGIKGDWLRDILVAAPTIMIASTVGASATILQLNIRGRPQQVIPLSLEVRNEGSAHAALPDIPFEVVMSQTGEITLSSERQQTPWRFLMKISAESKQMNVRFTLDYAGLSVAEALTGMTFYGSLVSGGELRIRGRHPVTGADLPIARGAIPVGVYQAPDARFVKILEQLAFIESKTGASFTIPERYISFEDANTIAATTRILETGHAQYSAQPWVSVSNVAQAKSALESFVTGAPQAMAIHFEGQIVDIFGTHVMLGPVTFFSDRTYIANEDLEDLRKELEVATPESSINIRLTPSEDCSVEARYINWLPEEEATAIRELPMYRERKVVVNEDQWDLPPVDVNNALALLRSWYDEDTAEQKNTWEQLKVALDQDRLSERKLFP